MKVVYTANHRVKSRTAFKITVLNRELTVPTKILDTDYTDVCTFYEICEPYNIPYCLKKSTTYAYNNNSDKQQKYNRTSLPPRSYKFSITTIESLQITIKFHCAQSENRLHFGFLKCLCSLLSVALSEEA